MPKPRCLRVTEPSRRILVVDDDPLVSRSLVDVLSRHGYPAVLRRVRRAGARAAGEREAFDLVILDVRTARHERVRDLRAHPRALRARAAGADPHGASATPPRCRKGYEAGADDFLQKPVDTPALVLKVRAFLRLKSLHDEMLRHREEAQARARATWRCCTRSAATGR